MADLRWFRRACASRASRLTLALLALVSVCGLAAVEARAQTFPLALRLDLPGSGYAPTVAVAGDVNGDGVVDLVAGTAGGSDLLVMLGLGHGRFAARKVIAVGGTGNTTGLALADFNGDGNLDVAIADDETWLRVMLGNGGGQFGRLSSTYLTFGVYGVAAGDLDGDGFTDLVTSNRLGNNVSVLRGDGTGVFATHTEYATGSGPMGIALADLDNDGALDVVCAAFASSAVNVLRGLGDGRLAGAATHAAATGPRDLAVADLNGDGNLDVVVANATAGSVSVFQGDGTGYIGMRIDYATLATPIAIAVGDVNENQLPDVLVASTGGGFSNLSAFPVNANATLGSRSDLTSTIPGSVAVVDVNADGHPDLVTAVPGSGAVSLYLAQGAGPFYPRGWMTTPAAVGTVVAFQEFTSATSDFAATIPGSDILRVSRSANGFWTEGSRTDLVAGSGAWGIAVGSFDSQYQADFVVTNSNTNTVSVFLSGANWARTDYTVGSQPCGVALGDVTHDGYPDIVVANLGSGTVSILPRNGSGTFGARTDVTVMSLPFVVTLADVSQDGWVDLVLTNRAANFVSVMLGTAGGSFGPRVDYALGAPSMAAAVGDFNEDGRPDIVVTTGSGSTFSYLRNTGGGAFAARIEYTVGNSPTGIAVGDLNRDGHLDVVTANVGSNNLSVVLGNGAGGFAASQDVTPYAAGLSGGVALGDADGDGNLDALAGGSTTAGVYALYAPADVKVGLTVSTPLQSLNGAVTCTAKVTRRVAAAESPTGTVRFFDGTRLLGSADLPQADSTVAFTTWAYPIGTRSLTAVYDGSPVFADGRSAAVPVRVVPTFAPRMAGVRDVPNDQGGHVRVAWGASPYDVVPSTLMDTYWIWRQVPVRAAEAALAAGARLVADGDPTPPAVGAALRVSKFGAQSTYWEFVAASPAAGLPNYSYVASTLGDSLGGSNPRTWFMVQARRSSTGQHWDSAPDSGYSVDNLAPAAPAALAGTYASGAIHLHWAPGAAADLAGYRVYRGVSSDFTPSPDNLVGAVSDTAWAATPNAPYWYKVSAVDVHGNESAFASLFPAGTVGVEVAGPRTLALEGVTPNPARAARWSVAFVLPDAAPATLELLDVAGRRLEKREVGTLGAGRHVLELSPARRPAPGLYLVRLSRGSVTCVGRATLLD